MFFDLLLAEIGKGDGQLGPDLVAYRARNANPAGLGERFEPGRDVDTVAKQILALDEDIADMHADAEAHWLTHGAGGVFFGDGILNCDRTLDGVDRTGEVGDDTVAGAAEKRPRRAEISSSRTTRQAVSRRKVPTSSCPISRL
jgi:hypothetical protein